jgi:hypothetical protein
VNLRSGIGEGAVFHPEFIVGGAVSLVEPTPSEPYEISAEDSLGIDFKLKASDLPGPGIVQIGGKLTVGDAEIQIHPIHLHAAVAPMGQPVEVPDDDPMVKVVSNGCISTRVNRVGGQTEITLFDTGQSVLKIHNEEIGEPYSWEFDTYEYEVTVETTPYEAKILCSAQSRDFPGLRIHRRTVIGTGTDIVVGVTLTNNGPAPFNGGVRRYVAATRQDGVVLPVDNCIVAGYPEGSFGPEFPFPKELDKLPEKWVAWLASGFPSGEQNATGLIFEGASKIKWVRWATPMLVHTVENLAPGRSIAFPDMRVLANAPGWREVQRAALKGDPSALPLRTEDFFQARGPVFSDLESACIGFRSMITVPNEAKVRAVFPDGSVGEAESDQWRFGFPIETPIPALDPKHAGLRAVKYTMQSGPVERSGQLPLIVPVPNSKVDIARGREGDYEFFAVKNGAIEFRVAPKFNGTLYWLSDSSAPDKNLLRTTFPEPGMWTWMSPWFGGISMEAELGYWFHHSQFDGDPVGISWSGFEWEGIRVRIAPLKRWQSLEMEVLYLTRPGVPIVLNLCRFTEKAGCRRSFSFEMSIFSCPSGDTDVAAEALIGRAPQDVRIAASIKGGGSASDQWVATYDPKTLKTLGSVVGNGGLYLWNAAEAGKAVWASCHINTIPGKTVETAILHSVADSPDLIAPLAIAINQWHRVVATSEPRALVLQNPER